MPSMKTYAEVIDDSEWIKRYPHRQNTNTTNNTDKHSIKLSLSLAPKKKEFCSC